LVVSAKTLPRAVDRNRLKRLLRELLRASRPDVIAFDLVIRLKRPATREVLADVAREAAALIREAIRNAPATARDAR
jgi:ribonuclease P protein component